jgi:hypothetical protein
VVRTPAVRPHAGRFRASRCQNRSDTEDRLLQDDRRGTPAVPVKFIG